MNDLRQELILKRLDSALKAAEDCRKRESMMMNFSIIIYGALVFFAFNQIQKPMLSYLTLLFSMILIGLIGLFIARLNAIERYHYDIEKRIYECNKLENYELLFEKKWGLKTGFNKKILITTYNILILSLYFISLYMLFLDSRNPQISLYFLVLLPIIYMIIYNVILFREFRLENNA